MRRELEAIYHELQRRSRNGEKAVYLSDESLAILRDVSSSAPPPVSAPVEAELGANPEPTEKPPSRTTKAKKEIETPPPPVVDLPEGSKKEQWDYLKELVLSDSWCQSQVKPGKKVVFGVGSLDSPVFFCGEAPGAEEEILGEPFVGPAGQLLTKIIQAMGLSREQVYIGNIMNYRPPMPSSVGNRPPTGSELAYCLPYLKAQLAVVQPKVIIAMGKTAVEGLLGPDPKRRMTRIRGQWVSFENIDLILTFHPSYLLRNQSMKTKREVWEDMLAVMEKTGMPISDKQRGYFL